MLKKAATSLVLVSLLLLPSEAGAAPSIDITAKSAIVMEATTGKILFEKNADERRYPASTTKIMTLITALEKGNLEDQVTASTHAAETEGSSLWLTAGEQLPLLDMLYGIMLISGNDATVAVAEHIAGSVEAFAGIMTQRAHQLGATHSHFVNTSGLPDVNHYTTAHDMAIITAYGYRLPLFREIVSTKQKIMPWQGKEFSRDLYNENKLLWLYEGANGVKTGYTDAAGRCLVSGAEKNGIQLIAVVFDSEKMWEDSIALLDFGFGQMSLKTMLEERETVKTLHIIDGKTETVALAAASPLQVPMIPGDEGSFKTVVHSQTKISAPVQTGQKLGEAKVLYNDVEVASVDLIAVQSVEKKSFFGTLWGTVQGIFSFFFRNWA